MSPARLALALALLLAAPSLSAQERWTRPDATAARRDRSRAEHLAFTAGLPAEILERLGLPEDAAWRDVMRRRALDAVSRALAAEPDDPRALTLAAELRERLGDLAGALRDASRALALAPEGPDAPDLHFVLALAHTHLGAHAATRDDYLAALRFPLSDETRGVVLGNLADAWLVLGDTARAVETYRACVAATPEYALGWLGLAIALDREGDDPAEAATQSVRAASRRGGPDAILAELRREGVFFVPVFDRYTYEAMAHEALARMYGPGGELGDDPARARQHRVYARNAWEAWGAQAPPDDRWRPRVARHLHALAGATPPTIPPPR